MNSDFINYIKTNRFSLDERKTGNFLHYRYILGNRIELWSASDHKYSDSRIEYIFNINGLIDTTL